MSLPERCLSPELADTWIRECLRVDPNGAEITVSGSCMEPALGEGSRINLRRFQGPLRVGDVVLVRTPSGLRLHRVVARLGDRLRTKGDRGIYLDPAVCTADVIALWVTSESRALRLVRAARSLVRVFIRPARTFSRRTGAGDESHAGLLP